MKKTVAGRCAHARHHMVAVGSVRQPGDYSEARCRECIDSGRRPLETIGGPLGAVIGRLGDFLGVLGCTLGSTDPRCGAPGVPGNP